MKMKSIVILGVVAAVAAILVLAGCSGGGSGNGGGATSGPVKQTVITPTVSGDTVSIPASVITTKRNVDFKVTFDEGTANYAAYTLNNAIQVRASFCVPCRGTSFTLSGNNLICDNCGTVFSAQTGKGISGVPACQGYPKAAVPFTTDASGNVTMLKADLLKAFEDTLVPGLP